MFSPKLAGNHEFRDSLSVSVAILAGGFGIRLVNLSQATCDGKPILPLIGEP